MNGRKIDRTELFRAVDRKLAVTFFTLRVDRVIQITGVCLFFFVLICAVNKIAYD